MFRVQVDLWGRGQGSTHSQGTYVPGSSEGGQSGHAHNQDPRDTRVGRMQGRAWRHEALGGVVCNAESFTPSLDLNMSPNIPPNQIQRTWNTGPHKSLLMDVHSSTIRNHQNPIVGTTQMPIS